jgi:hypothetical protein
MSKTKLVVKSPEYSIFETKINFECVVIFFISKVNRILLCVSSLQPQHFYESILMNTYPTQSFTVS